MTENVVAPPPPLKASRRALPVEPMESCTVLTPSVSSSFCSTGLEASSLACRLVPGSSFCDTVNVFCPVEPRKFVFIKGNRRTVPLSTSTAIMIVATECRSVQWMIGR